MLEVLFSQSFNGCMRYASYARQEDICCLPLCLSVGDIRPGSTEDLIGSGREQAFSQLLFSAPEIERERYLQDSLTQSRTSLAALVERIRAGKPVRVWSSDNPDEACGLAWLIELFSRLGLEKTEVSLVALPCFDLGKNGVVIQYNGWGQVEPEDIERMAMIYTRSLPLGEKRALAMLWKQLQAENAPLRAVVSGRIASVPETFYDSLIMQELERQPEEFAEAQLIGTVLGRYPLGFGDGWIALRIEKILVAPGLLVPITKPKPGDSIYRRIVRKQANNILS